MSLVTIFNRSVFYCAIKVFCKFLVDKKMEKSSRAEMLKKWKEEKLLKIQQEKENKKPPFKCGFIAHKPPPFLISCDKPLDLQPFNVQKVNKRKPNESQIKEPRPLKVQKVNKMEPDGLQIKGTQTKSKTTRTKSKSNKAPVKISHPVQLDKTRIVVKHGNQAGKQKQSRKPLNTLNKIAAASRNANVTFGCQISMIKPIETNQVSSVVLQSPDGIHESCFVNRRSTVLSELQSNEQNRRTSTPKQSHLKGKIDYIYERRNSSNHKTHILSNLKKNIADIYASNTHQECLSNLEHHEIASGEIDIIATNLSEMLLLEFHQRKNQSKTASSVDAIISSEDASSESIKGKITTGLSYKGNQKNKHEETESTRQKISPKKISEICWKKTSTGLPRESTPYCFEKRAAPKALDSDESPISVESSQYGSAAKDQSVPAPVSSGLTRDFKRLCLESPSEILN